MSGFDRMLRGLSGGEMLECARGLLERLTGGGGGPARGGAGIAEIEPVGRGGAGPAAGPGRTARAGGKGGAQPQRRPGREFGSPEGPGGRGDYDWETEDAGRGGGGDAGSPAAEARRREGDLYGGPAHGRRDGESPGGAGPDAGAAFCGPERRYDGAVGARGTEMSRVSEFFRRDSRRYDAGCGLK